MYDETGGPLGGGDGSKRGHPSCPARVYEGALYASETNGLCICY